MYEAGACVDVCFTCGGGFMAVGFGRDGFVDMVEYGDGFVDVVFGGCGFGGEVLGGDVFVDLAIGRDGSVDVVEYGDGFLDVVFDGCGFGGEVLGESRFDNDLKREVTCDWLDMMATQRLYWLTLQGLRDIMMMIYTPKNHLLKIRKKNLI